MQCAIACLAKEGFAATATEAITAENVKADIIATRKEIVKKKGRANAVSYTHLDVYKRQAQDLPLGRFAGGAHFDEGHQKFAVGLLAAGQVDRSCCHCHTSSRFSLICSW